MPLLSSEQIRLLSAKSNFRGLVQLSFTFVCIVLCGFVLYLRLANYAVLNGVPIIVFWFLLGSRYQELQALQHECVHGNAFSSPWLNTMLGYLAAFINIFPNYWYQIFHMAHHKFTQNPLRDPELIFPRVQSNNLLGYLIAMSGLPTLVLLIGSLFYHAICGHIHPLESRFVKNAHQEALLVLEARCMLLAYTVLALIAWNLDLSWHLLQFWLWPLLSALPWTQIVGFAEHAACPYTSDMLANSRTTFANRLFSVLWWNANHHTAHHKYPTVPFFNLPSVTKLLQQEGLLSSVSASYVSFHYQFLTGKLPVYQSN